MPDVNVNQHLLFYLAFAWSILWKGLALWKAAKLEQKYWFIAMLILNTIGIVEILYLFRFAKQRMTIEELRFWEKKR